MDLDNTLQLLALQIPVDPEQLAKFAAEDVLGGYHIDAAKRTWTPGSIWEVEGKTLYALIRALKPETVVELGSWEGCSTTHIATALAVNGSGHLTAVDIDKGAGSNFPPNLSALRTVVTSDAIMWLAAQPDESIDFLFEDTSHTPDMCAAIISLCQTKLAPGGVLVMHDAGHDFAYIGDNQTVGSSVGAEVRSGIERVMGNNYRVYLTEPSDCGLAVMIPNPQRANLDVHSTSVNPVLAQAIAEAKAGDPAAVTKSLEDMTKAELQEYAKTRDIGLTGARTNKEIVVKIVEALYPASPDA